MTRVSTIERLEHCAVVDSSGCHRYEYWNEQHLFDGRLDTGWCCPSRDRSTDEYLVIQTNDARSLTAVRLQARATNKHEGFPERITVQTGSVHSWTTVASKSGLKPGLGEWVEIRFPPTATEFLCLTLSDAAIRPNGRQFTQFMNLELLVGEPQ